MSGRISRIFRQRDDDAAVDNTPQRREQRRRDKQQKLPRAPYRPRSPTQMDAAAGLLHAASFITTLTVTPIRCHSSHYFRCRDVAAIIFARTPDRRDCAMRARRLTDGAMLGESAGKPRIFMHDASAAHCFMPGLYRSTDADARRLLLYRRAARQRSRHQ